MTDERTMTKAELLANVEQGWNDFQAYLSTLTEDQLTRPTDPAGWTAKDHIIHLAIWEDSVNAFFQGTPRHEHMGVDESIFYSYDWDRINAVIQQRYKDMPLAEVMQTHRDIHQRLVAKVQSLSDADLQLPYNHYQPGTTIDRPAIHWVISDTYEHYDEHQNWIDAIVKKT